MPRLFTGLEIPAEVGFALSLKRGGLTGARWIDAENYHITLRFIGDVDHQTADEVARFIAVAGRFEPLSFPVGRFVLFSSRDSVGGGPYVVEQTYPLAA